MNKPALQDKTLEELEAAYGEPPVGIGASILSLPELLSLEIPERNQFLPFLYEGTLTMVYGPPGVGKTYWGLSLAVSIVCGGQFLKWRVTQAAGVLYVDGEMPLGVLRERLAALMPSNPIAPIEVLSHEHFYNQHERDLMLCQEDIQAELQSYLDSHPNIRVLILDNLSCLLPTVREDRRDDWAARVLPFLLWLRRRGITVVLMHHTGKDEKVQRGTSSRRDQLDVEIRLERVSEENNGAHFAVHFTKSRGVFGEEVQPFAARLVKDTLGQLEWVVEDIQQSTGERLLVLVKDGITSGTEAAEELGVTKGTVSKAAKRLRDEGILGPGPALRLA